MGWKFWEKYGGGSVNLPGPKELPNAVGRYLVVNLKHDPDWVWELKSVSKPVDGKKGTHHVRVFSKIDADTKGTQVIDYTSLDAHPELILFDGWYDKNSGKAEITDRSSGIRRTAA